MSTCCPCAKERYELLCVHRSWLKNNFKRLSIFFLIVRNIDFDEKLYSNFSLAVKKRFAFFDKKKVVKE
jgi:hypothetical protein